MKKKYIVFFILGCTLALGIHVILAMNITNAKFTLGCTSYEWDYDFTSDRDNTGSGRETWYVEIFDGAGKLIHTHSGYHYYNWTGHDGPTTLSYNVAAPDYNPLRYQWVSEAGNGLTEQVIYETTGTCAGLPTYGATPTPPPILVIPPTPTPTCINPDHRENPFCDYPWQTATIYCQYTGKWQALDVYGYTPAGDGYLAIRVYPEELVAIGTPAENTLIATSEDGTIRLYKLWTGKYQVNAPGSNGDDYVFIWDGCDFIP